MKGYSCDLNIYIRQVNKIISDYLNKTVYAQREISDAVNSSDFSKAIELTLTSTQISNFISQNKIFVGHFTEDAMDMGIMLCGELIKVNIVKKAIDMFSEEAIAEALMNVSAEDLIDLSNEYDSSAFEEYHVYNEIDDDAVLQGCIIEYTHADKEPTRIEMNFDKYALNDWLNDHILVVDGALQFNYDPMDNTSQQAL